MGECKDKGKNGTAGEVEIQGEFNEQNITLTDSGQIKCGDYLIQHHI
jgi:hypothetical protein